MLRFLEGVLVWVADDLIWLEVRGVGYEVHMHPNALSCLPALGSELRVYTYLDVQEKELRLFGFLRVEQLRQFRLLLAVSGIGAKLAQTITAGLSMEELQQAVMLTDEKRLMTIPGIGKKMASRLIFELKDQVSSMPITVVDSDQQQKSRSETFAALEILGYRRAEVLPLWLELQEQGLLTEHTDANLKLLLQRLAQKLSH